MEDKIRQRREMNVTFSDHALRNILAPILKGWKEDNILVKEDHVLMALYLYVLRANMDNPTNISQYNAFPFQYRLWRNGDVNICLEIMIKEVSYTLRFDPFVMHRSWHHADGTTIPLTEPAPVVGLPLFIAGFSYKDKSMTFSKDGDYIRLLDLLTALAGICGKRLSDVNGEIKTLRTYYIHNDIARIVLSTDVGVEWSEVSTNSFFNARW